MRVFGLSKDLSSMTSPLASRGHTTGTSADQASSVICHSTGDDRRTSGFLVVEWLIYPSITETVASGKVTESSAAGPVPRRNTSKKPNT